MAINNWDGVTAPRHRWGCGEIFHICQRCALEFNTPTVLVKIQNIQCVEPLTSTVNFQSENEYPPPPLGKNSNPRGLNYRIR